MVAAAAAAAEEEEAAAEKGKVATVAAVSSCRARCTAAEKEQTRQSN